MGRYETLIIQMSKSSFNPGLADIANQELFELSLSDKLLFRKLMLALERCLLSF